MSSINNDSFTTYFPLWMPLVSLSCLAALDRTSSPMLNKSSESGHPCLAPDLREKAFSFSLLIMMLAMGLVTYGVCYVEIWSLYGHFIESFYHKWMFNFVKCLLCLC